MEKRDGEEVAVNVDVDAKHGHVVVAASVGTLDDTCGEARNHMTQKVGVDDAQAKVVGNHQSWSRGGGGGGGVVASKRIHQRLATGSSSTQRMELLLAR